MTTWQQNAFTDTNVPPDYTVSYLLHALFHLVCTVLHSECLQRSRRLTCGDLHEVVRPALDLECQGVALARVDGCVAVVGTLQNNVYGLTAALSIGMTNIDFAWENRGILRYPGPILWRH